jgi:hypothetical protein
MFKIVWIPLEMLLTSFELFGGDLNCGRKVVGRLLIYCQSQPDGPAHTTAD